MKTETETAPITETETAKPAAKPRAPRGKKTETAKTETAYSSLTGGGSRPAIYGAKIPAEIKTRHSYLFSFLEKSGLINAREISYFIGIRPHIKKSGRVSDFFKFSGKNIIGKFPADKFKSEKLSISAAIKKYPALNSIGKLNDVIIYLTADYGTKKITLNFSFKY